MNRCQILLLCYKFRFHFCFFFLSLFAAYYFIQNLWMYSLLWLIYGNMFYLMKIFNAGYLLSLPLPYALDFIEAFVFSVHGLLQKSNQIKKQHINLFASMLSIEEEKKIFCKWICACSHIYLCVCVCARVYHECGIISHILGILRADIFMKFHSNCSL